MHSMERDTDEEFARLMEGLDLHGEVRRHRTRGWIWSGSGLLAVLAIAPLLAVHVLAAFAAVCAAAVCWWRADATLRPFVVVAAARLRSRVR